MYKVLFGFLLVVVILVLAISNVSAKQGQDMVLICSPKGNGEWHPIQVSIASWNGHGHPGAFLIDDDHPCPPENIEPTPEPPQTHMVAFPIIVHTLDFFMPIWIP